MKDAIFDPNYGDEAVAPLTRAQLATLESLWSAARTEIKSRSWTWRQATGADESCFESEFGYDIADGQIRLFGAEYEEREDQDRRYYTHYTGDSVHADFPLALLALSERSFNRWCARIKRERLKAQAAREAAARTAADKAAREQTAAAKAKWEKSERTQLANLLAKYGPSGGDKSDG